jgi:hypothetical protein
MFDPQSLVDQEPGLNLPDDFDTLPIVELVRKAFNLGADQASDAESVAPLLQALKSIKQTTTDPVARLAAERALATYQTINE